MTIRSNVWLARKDEIIEQRFVKLLSTHSKITL